MSKKMARINLERKTVTSMKRMTITLCLKTVLLTKRGNGQMSMKIMNLVKEKVALKLSKSDRYRCLY